MEQNKIFVSTSTFGEIDSQPIGLLESNGFTVIKNPYKRRLTPQELRPLLSGVVGLIAGVETIDRETIIQSSLKVISRCGVEMSNVDVVAAQEKGITVLNTPDAPTNAVAELTVAALLSLLRSVPAMNQDLHAGTWNKKLGLELKGRNILIIGFGRIGRRVKELLFPFQVHIKVVDPALDTTMADTPVVSLQEGLPWADIIIIHASGKNLILGKEEFNLIKEGAYILNPARGETVHEPSLLEALKNNKIRGAWIDTFVEEPYAGSLLQYDNVLLTPHVGSYTAQCRLIMELEAARNALRVLAPHVSF